MSPDACTGLYSRWLHRFSWQGNCWFLLVINVTLNDTYVPVQTWVRPFDQDWCSWPVLGFKFKTECLASFFFVLGCLFSFNHRAFIVNLISLSVVIVVYFPGLSADFLLPLTLNITAGACLLGLILSGAVLLYRKFVWQSSKSCSSRTTLCISFKLAVRLPPPPAQKKGSNWYRKSSIVPS